MNIKCINKGEFKNLTVGFIYEILNETNTKYLIVNDKGSEASYGKGYFALIEEPAPVPEPPKEVSIEVDEDGVKLYIGDNQVASSGFESSWVAENCGVHDYSINDAMLMLVENGVYSKENIEKVIQAFLNYDEKPLIIFSTNKEYPELWTVLDDMCGFSSKEMVNPSSGNYIKLWGIYNEAV